VPPLRSPPEAHGVAFCPLSQERHLPTAAAASDDAAAAAATAAAAARGSKVKKGEAQYTPLCRQYASMGVLSTSLHISSSAAVAVAVACLPAISMKAQAAS
jgi:hypothetical protein